MATAFDSPGRMVSEAVLRRARVEQKFSLAVTARQIEDIYRAALEARYTTLRASAVAEADVSR